MEEKKQLDIYTELAQTEYDRYLLVEYNKHIKRLLLANINILTKKELKELVKELM